MDKTISPGFSKTLFYFHRAYDFLLFLRRDHDLATAAAVAVHRASNNRLYTYYDFELFCLFVRFSTGCRARSPGKSGRGPAPGSSVHYPAVPSDARRRGAAGSARKAARTGSISRGRFFHHPRIYGERALFFCGEIMTQRPATAGPAAAAAAAAVHRACYNQLSTTLQRYRAQQQQATPCACDRSALYCVELLWKAPEIHHPSHLLVPEVYLGCC